ncbi:IS3 family transposase [Neobacillus cucumis]
MLHLTEKSPLILLLQVTRLRTRIKEYIDYYNNKRI